MKQREIQKEKKQPKIDGLEDFDLSIVGLTVKSIERSGGHVKIPLELVPFLKICKVPAYLRKRNAKYHKDWVLKLRRKGKRERKAH